jgi:hypothetical protein
MENIVVTSAAAEVSRASLRRRFIAALAAMTTFALAFVASPWRELGEANADSRVTPSAAGDSWFSGRYAHRTIEVGIGQSLPQEAPQAFANAVLDVDGFA